MCGCSRCVGECERRGGGEEGGGDESVVVLNDEKGKHARRPGQTHGLPPA